MALRLDADTDALTPSVDWIKLYFRVRSVWPRPDWSPATHSAWTGESL